MKITEFAALRVATRTEEAGVVDPWVEVSNRSGALDRYSRRFQAQNKGSRQIANDSYRATRAVNRAGKAEESGSPTALGTANRLSLVR